MRNRTRTIVAAAFVSVLAFLASMSFGDASAQQEPAKAGFDASKSMAANLTAQTGKIVEVHLQSGKSVAGKVEAANDNVLHLSNLSGKEFYDSLIKVSAIEAVEVRVRK